MTRIFLDENQSKAIAEASDDIGLFDPNGNLLGFVTSSFTKEEIAEAKRRLSEDQPRYSTQQVLDYLASLERQA